MLPAVLAVLVLLAMLAALALLEAARESRVAALGMDRLTARSAAIEGLSRVWFPPDLPGLCLQPPVFQRTQVLSAAGGASIRLGWRHLGHGLIRAEVEGVGPQGARQRVRAFLRPDSLTGDPPVGCAAATRLAPAAADWLEGHPEG